MREMGVGDARCWAKVMHTGQSRIGGATYFTHLERVAALVEAAGGDAEQVQIAWLHDILEDTPTSADHLRAAGFAERVVRAVEVLTKEEPRPLVGVKGEVDREYIARLVADGNPDALLVKRADLLDNAFDDRERPGMWKRYERNLRLLAPDIFVATGFEGDDT